MLDEIFTAETLQARFWLSVGRLTAGKPGLLEWFVDTLRGGGGDDG